MSVITDQRSGSAQTVVHFSGLPTAREYGSIDGTNASPAIQAQIAAEGRFVLPVGDFKVQDPITFPASGAFGGHCYGAGPERSRLIASSMDGEAVIKPAGTSQYVRLNLSDFGIVGNGTVVGGVTSQCDHAIDLTVVSPYQLYQSSFRNLWLSSNDSAFVAPRLFLTRFDRVDVWSNDGHGFEIRGGNTVSLINCYAHDVGVSKAGYRILTAATLIDCNGVDEATNDCYWGWFGDNGAVKGIYKIGMIGCNLEDFGSIALRLDYTGWIELKNCPIQARATGTYRCAILTDGSSNHVIIIDHGTFSNTKGATRTGAEEIIADGGATFVDVVARFSSTNFDEYYRTSTLTSVANTVKVLIS